MSYPTNNKSVQLFKQAFERVNRGSENMFHIVITDVILTNKPQTYRFQVRANFYTHLLKHCRRQNIAMDYLCVIEYGKEYSIGEYVYKHTKEIEDLKGLGLHAHCIVRCNLDATTITNIAKANLPNGIDVKVFDISQREDREGLCGYLCKQQRILNQDNFEIKLRPKKNKQIN